MDDFVAYNSPWRIALITLGSIGAVVGGLWLVGAFGDVPTSRRYSVPITVGIGWICVFLFSLFAVGGARKLYDRGVQLQIGPAGIRTAPWSDQLIPWSDISDATTWAYNRQKFIVLHLHNPERFPGRGLYAKLAGANRMMTGGDIAISLTGTDRDHEDAMSAISRFGGFSS